MNLRRQHDPYVEKRLNRLKRDDVQRLTKEDIEQLERLIPLRLGDFLGTMRYDSTEFRIALLKLLKHGKISCIVMNRETRRRRLLNGKSN